MVLRIQNDVQIYLLEPGEEFWMLYGDFPHVEEPIMAEIKTDMGGIKAAFSVTKVSIIEYEDYCLGDRKPGAWEKCFKDKLKEEVSKQNCTVAEYEVLSSRKGNIV